MGDYDKDAFNRAIREMNVRWQLREFIRWIKEGRRNVEDPLGERLEKRRDD